MDNLELFFTVALMGFSLILFVISAITYKRVKSTRLLLVSAAFGLFFIKGLALAAGLDNPRFRDYGIPLPERCETIVIVVSDCYG